MTLCSAGNYIAGTVWPPVVQHLIAVVGWRETHAAIGLFCLATMPPLALAACAGGPAGARVPGGRGARGTPANWPFAPGVLQTLLGWPRSRCCVAMSMPQVHIVAYCGDLGYGVARGAEMLSLMLGFGIVSRIGSGFIADRIGGLPTLLLGSVLQGVALVLYLFFDSLVSLYVISALFGLFQGGIVPSYAIIVREYFPAKEAARASASCSWRRCSAWRFGGWMSGVIFDLTGSYRAAFANGLAWNVINGAIVLWLLFRRHHSRIAYA